MSPTEMELALHPKCDKCKIATVKATPQNTQKERPCGKIPLGRAYIRHSISAAAALI